MTYVKRTPILDTWVDTAGKNRGKAIARQKTTLLVAKYKKLVWNIGRRHHFQASWRRYLEQQEETTEHWRAALHMSLDEEEEADDCGVTLPPLNYLPCQQRRDILNIRKIALVKKWTVLMTNSYLVNTVLPFLL